MNQSNRTRKLALAGLLTAVAVVGGMFSIPIGAAKCSPVQHMVNVIAGVLLGPWYGLGSAFVASLIRNLIGTGSLLAAIQPAHSIAQGGGQHPAGQQAVVQYILLGFAPAQQ